MMKVLQVLFNKPLQFDDEVLYGFRVPSDDRAMYIMNYGVEEVIGKWCFLQRHGGKIEDKTKWIDKNGKIYRSGDSTRQYSYTAALDTHTYFRVDEYWVDDDCNLANAKITDAADYFNLRCVMEEQDYKTGYNRWLIVYQKLFSRYQRQLYLANNSLLKLDYDEQEYIVDVQDEGYCVKKKDSLDKLSL